MHLQSCTSSVTGNGFTANMKTAEVLQQNGDAALFPDRSIRMPELPVPARIMNLKEQLSEADRLIGIADFTGAVHLLDEVRSEAESCGDRETAAIALNRTGRTYSSLGNPELAIRYHLRALAIFENAEDARGLSETYNHIGTIWSEEGNRSEALRFKLQALEAARRSGDVKELSRAYNNIGEEYRLLSRNADAREQYIKSLELDKKAGNMAYEAICLHNLALVSAGEEDYEKARELFERSLSLSSSAIDREMEAETLVFWGESEVKAGRLDLAKPLLCDALARAEVLGSPRILAAALRHMAEYYRKNGDFPNAFLTLEKFTQIESAKLNAAQAKRLLAVSIEIEMERVREEARRLETEAQELKRRIEEQTREIQNEKDQALRLRDSAQKTLEDFLLALASTIEAKDSYTGGHVERVAGYSLALARKLGLPVSVCRSVYLGAIVHDVGKISVHDLVLNKPGKLDPEELDAMRRHSTTGHDILARIHGLDTASEIALYHHERWDGDGYPRRLRGTDIPLAARIVSLADFWDAIVTDRPYRTAMPRHQALALMASERGKAFDPDLYDLFMDGQEKVADLYSS